MNNYFQYNGVCYSSGTVVSIVDKYIKYYSHKMSFLKCNEDKYLFITLEEDGSGFIKSINKNCVNKVIESVIYPVYVKNYEGDKRKDSDDIDVIIGWGWYIFIMILFAIFRYGFIGWVAVSITFFKWRNKKLTKN